MIIKKAVRISGHSTSVSLEPIFWEVLKKHCTENKISMSSLITDIDSNRSPADNLSSTIRTWVVRQLQETIE